MKSYLKIPIELSQFALRERKISQVQSYLASQFIYPGKACISAQPAKKIASLLQISERNIYRSFDWLLSRNWMGKDSVNEWYFFRGLNRIHLMERWKYSRAVIIQEKDLHNIKPFFISAVISSAIKTGRKREGGTDQQPRRSTPIRFPVPVSFLEKVLSVSRRTAIRYFKIAKNAGFIDVYPNMKPVINLTPSDVRHLKTNDIESVTVQLIGNQEFHNKPINHLRIDRGKVFLQGVNLIQSHLLLGKRRIKEKNRAQHSVAIKGDSFVSGL